MRGRPWRAASAAALWLALGLVAAPAAAGEPARDYALRASVDVERGVVTGTMRLAYRHDAACPTGTLVFLLAPNRLATPPDLPIEALDARYPAGFEPAQLAVTDVTDPSGEPLAHVVEGRRLTVALPAPLAPGERTALSLSFRMTVPVAEGLVGRLGGNLRVQGGWHPLLGAWDGASCRWRVDRLPPRARFDALIGAADDVTVVSAGAREPAEDPGAAPAEAGTSRFVAEGRYLPLVAARGYRRIERVEGPVRLEAYAYGLDRRRARAALDTAADALRAFEARHGPLPGPLVLRLAEGDLAAGFAAWAEGVILLDPGYRKILAWLRPFHDRQVTYRVFEALWAYHLAARGADAPPWVVEALAAIETRAAEGRIRRGVPRLERTARRFGFVPFVDEFLYSGRTPNRPAYQQTFTAVEDPQDLARLDAPALPGSRIARKLEPLVGQDALAAVAVAYGADPAGADFVSVLLRLARRDLAPFVAEWTTQPRAVDYGIEVGPARRLPEGPDRYETAVRLRAGPPAQPPPAGLAPEAPAHEGVPVVVTFQGGEERREVLETTTGETLTLRSDRRISIVEVDPERVTEDRWREDNREPPRWRILLTRLSASLDIRQGELEFSIGGTAQRGFGREPVFGAGAFRNQESIGVGLSVGQRLGDWPAGVRHTVGLGVSFEQLDRGFGPVQETARNVTELDLGYGIDSRTEPRNPLTGMTAGLDVTWSDELLGSDAHYTIVRGRTTRYVRVGPNRALAFRFEVGETVDGDPPFGKGLLLGGVTGLRAYPENRFGGESLSLGSVEYRFPIVRDLDQWVLGVVGLGPLSGVLGLEAGQTSPDHNPFHRGGFKSGVNVGLRCTARVFGVSPVLWSFDAAMPLDGGPQPGDTQFYISASQTF